MTQEIFPDDQQLVIYLLSKEIEAAQRSCAQEREAPRYSSDQSDDRIKEMRERTLKLRDLRQQVETLFWGAIG